jgi:hypothetical protein
VRRVVLDEDCDSVAFPEGHGKGLVPFCVENLRLGIECRVNLWRKLFLRASRMSAMYSWMGRP